MQTHESTMAGARGVTLHTTIWTAEAGEPIADVVIVHGYAEHSGRYRPVAETLTAAGFRVATLDLRGHGRSTGVRIGDIDDFALVVDDVAAFVDSVRSERPLFVYGHSMGGLVAVRLAERDDSRLAGLVVASASLAAAESIPAPLVKVANVLGKIAPGLRTITLDGNAISRVPEVRAEYDADPLNFRGKITAGTGRQLNMSMAAAHADAARISCPVLILHGDGDQLTAVSGSKAFAGEVSSSDSTLRIWPGAFHELHHEPERDEVLSTIVDWIRERV